MIMHNNQKPNKPTMLLALRGQGFAVVNFDFQGHSTFIELAVYL